MKTFLCYLLSLLLSLAGFLPLEVLADPNSSTPDLGLTAPSAVLMEAETGTILYAKDENTSRNPASITKIMTLILIFDALADGKIQLSDDVTTSAHAKSMGGSQVFLEEGEIQSVETMIKCIVVASGNDASVAMAEHIAGTETEFVRQMNARAQSLGMTQTNFVDCCGLTEDPAHHTSAMDVAIMSRELITMYPEIFKYSTIWMENITHVTKQGSKEFGLANTNKLLKMNTSFEVTGLKTGSTSLAKYCLSATARKDGVNLIAVIMAAPNYKVRFSEAQALLNYGFANCKLYRDTTPPLLEPVPVQNGVLPQVQPILSKEFSYLSTSGEDFTHIEKKIIYQENLTAPIVKGSPIGKLYYYLGDKELGAVDILAGSDVKKAGYWDYFKILLDSWFL